MTAFLMRCCVMVARQTLTLFVWVQILAPQPYNPNGVIFFEVWLSLVERCVRDAEVAGSSPVTSTKIGTYRMVLADFIFSHFRGEFLERNQRPPRRRAPFCDIVCVSCALVPKRVCNRFPA